MFENNAICKLLNIKYPIFQGGMAWIGTAELASAVSNAGGLGIIGAGHMPPEILRAEIQKCKGWTDKPFGVNVMLMSRMSRKSCRSSSRRRYRSSRQARQSGRVRAGTQGNRCEGHPGRRLGRARKAPRALRRRCLIAEARSRAATSVRSRRWPRAADCRCCRCAGHRCRRHRGFARMAAAFALGAQAVQMAPASS